MKPGPRRLTAVAAVAAVGLLAGCTNNGNGDSATTNGVTQGPSKGPHVSISPGGRGPSPHSTPKGDYPINPNGS